MRASLPRGRRGSLPRSVAGRADGAVGGGPVMSRRCSRPACKQAALYTLTYVYRDSTAVLGPLATYVEPHCYDLCAAHADRLTVPRGWDVVRLPAPADPDPPEADDLEALANAVREAALPPGVEPVGQGDRGQPAGPPAGAALVPGGAAGLAPEACGGLCTGPPGWSRGRRAPPAGR